MSDEGEQIQLEAEIHRIVRELEWIKNEEGLDRSIRRTAIDSIDLLGALLPVLRNANTLVTAVCASEKLAILFAASRLLDSMTHKDGSDECH